MRLARISFSHMVLHGGLSKHLLTDILQQLPSDTKFMGCAKDNSSLVDSLVFESKSFFDTSASVLIPEITPILKRLSSGDVYLEKLEYPWDNKTSLVTRNCPNGNHTWQNYQGLSESYDYCVDCGARK